MRRSLAVATAAVLLGAFASAQKGTDPCIALNLRPCPIWGEFGTDLSIRQVIADLTMFGPRINATSAQNRSGLFQPRPATAVTLTFAYDRFFGPGQFMGIYKAGRPERKIMIFEGGNVVPGDMAVLVFRRNGDVYLNGKLAARSFGTCFGLYVEVYGGTPGAGGSGDPGVLDWTHYSEDARNWYGDPQMLAYRGTGKCVFKIPQVEPFWFMGDQFLFGVENLPCTPRIPGAVPADRDYNDAVVLLSGVRVARPTAMPSN